MRKIRVKLIGADYEVKTPSFVDAGMVGIRIEIEKDGKTYNWDTTSGRHTQVNREELEHGAKMLAERAAWLDLDALADNRLDWLIVPDEFEIVTGAESA